jgi:hypothetical protein
MNKNGRWSFIQKKESHDVTQTAGVRDGAESSQNRAGLHRIWTSLLESGQTGPLSLLSPLCAVQGFSSHNLQKLRNSLAMCAV